MHNVVCLIYTKIKFNYTLYTQAIVRSRSHHTYTIYTDVNRWYSAIDLVTPVFYANTKYP